jgi:NTE family protein
VLECFEDHHIPVDYIAGTSMGGLVAGLYATGKTPQQLANLVSAQLARLTFMDVAGYRSEWRTDLQFGNTYGVESELYRPFNATTKWFFAPRGDATDTALKIFHKGNPLADYRILRADIGMDIGYTLSRFTEIRVGYEVGDYDAKLRLGTPEFFSHAGRLGDTRLHFLTDHRDDPVVPHRGYSLDGTFQWFDTNPGANGAFPLMQARADYFLPVQSAASVFVVGEGGTSFGSTHIGVPQFFLGGARAAQRLRHE